MKMQEEESHSQALVDNVTDFSKSLKELKDFSSQLYHAADYCQTTFLNAKDKKIVVENTKEYVSQAIVTFVDHIGSISATVEYCISKSNYVPQTEERIESLKLRLLTCQGYSHKVSLHRFYNASAFSRYHCRYISPPLANSYAKNGTEKGLRFETDEPLFLCTYNCKPLLGEDSTISTEKKSTFSPPVLPVSDNLSILPKADLSRFQFQVGFIFSRFPSIAMTTLQEGRRLKRSSLNWKMMHNKEITSLIRRGKRILT